MPKKKDYIDYQILNDDQIISLDRETSRKTYKLKWFTITFGIVFGLCFMFTVIFAVLHFAIEVWALLIPLGIFGLLTLIFGGLFLGFLIKFFHFLDNLSNISEKKDE